MRELDNVSKMEIFQLFLKEQEISYFRFNRSKQDYINYRFGNLIDASEDKLLEMEILSLLDRLGYPMNEIGTYLYKEVILSLVEYMNNIGNKGNVSSYLDLTEQLNNSYSQFYFDIARNDLDMGLKSFHNSIGIAIDKIDYTKTDSSLLSSLCEQYSYELNYGELAFEIASLILGYSKAKEDKHVLVKRLNG